MSVRVYVEVELIGLAGGLDAGGLDARGKGRIEAGMTFRFGLEHTCGWGATRVSFGAEIVYVCSVLCTCYFWGQSSLPWWIGPLPPVVLLSATCLCRATPL